VWIDRWRTKAQAGPWTGASAQILSTPTRPRHRLPLPDKPLVVHGTGGISRKGTENGQSSHYYSWTNLATRGSLTIGGESFDVAGTSWMDHEFGSADLSPELVGWDWFSLQMADQTEVMLYRLRRADGSAHPVSSGTFIDQEGGAHPPQGFHVGADQFWTSPLSRSLPAAMAPDRAFRNLSLVGSTHGGAELRTDRSTVRTGKARSRAWAPPAGNLSPAWAIWN
jgi:predicted secreted hydrolase